MLPCWGRMPLWQEFNSLVGRCMRRGAGGWGGGGGVGGERVVSSALES